MKILNSLQTKLLKNKISTTDDIKLIIGAANTHYEGWIATDKKLLDITREEYWARLFKKGSISNILAEHVFEHLCYHDVVKAMRLCKKYLRTGGRLRIAVPDANNPSRYVYDLTKPGGIEPGADDHKIFFDVEIIERLAKELDFKLEFIENFDSNGFFHKKEYDEKDGYISRCSKNYKGRFTNSEQELEKFYNSIPEKNLQHIKDLGITYTSLLFDFIKK